MTPVEAAAILGVPLSVSAVVLRARRIQLVKRLHPDVCTGNVSEFVRVQQAFEVLSSFVETQDVPVEVSSDPVAVEVPVENAPAPNPPKPAQERPVYRANLAESVPVEKVVEPVEVSAIDAIFDGGTPSAPAPAPAVDPFTAPARVEVPVETAVPEPPTPTPDTNSVETEPARQPRMPDVPSGVAVPAAAATAFAAARLFLAPLSPLTVEIAVPFVIAAALVVAALAVVASNTLASRTDIDELPVPLPVPAAAAGVAVAFVDTLVYAAGPIAAVAAVVLAATAPKRS